MGRELKRVRLDFDWPLNKVWSGYLDAGYRACAAADCKAGFSPEYQWLEAVVRLLLLAGEDGKRGPAGSGAGIWPHPWLRELPTRPDCNPPAGLARLTEALAGRKMSWLGHDGQDVYVVCTSIIGAAGLPEKWGVCQTCNGSGEAPASKARRWKRTHPPKGSGYQVWETVSHGSPISPVFKNTRAVVAWLVACGYSDAAARGFVRVGSAPSGMLVGGKTLRDIEACAVLGK